MKQSKLICLGLTSALIFGAVYADDFDFGAEDFNFGASGDSNSSSPVEIQGSVESSVRSYINGEDSVENLPMNAVVQGNIDLKYSGSYADAELKLKLNTQTLKDNPENILDEAFVTSYFGNFKVDTGLMKNVWGKGDKLHVIDNFNADDYSDFIVPDYLERRVATPMLKASYAIDYSGNILSNMKVEAVYTPFLPVDKFAENGPWVPQQVSTLKEVVALNAKANLSYLIENSDDNKAAYLEALTNASSLSQDSSIIYPNTMLFKYGQAGTRFTASLGAVDLGLSYYYGHYKQPSVNITKMNTAINKYLLTGTLSEEDKFLAYDQKQTFGIEAATILWHFNVRGEACYNLTEDVEGTNPWVHNNSIQWLGGFDIDLPWWNMNINVQETGTYILKNEEIKGSMFELYDVDYNKNAYTSNKLVTNITTSFKNEQILPELTVMYGIESGDLVLMPKIVIKPSSELSLTLTGMYICTRDEYSQFEAWNKNNFVQLGACINF